MNFNLINNVASPLAKAVASYNVTTPEQPSFRPDAPGAPVKLRRCPTVYGESIRSLLDDYDTYDCGEGYRRVDSLLYSSNDREVDMDVEESSYDDYFENYTLPEEAMYGNEYFDYAMEVESEEEEEDVMFCPHPNVNRFRGDAQNESDEDDEEDEESVSNMIQHVNIIEYSDGEDETVHPHPNITLFRGSRRDTPMTLAELSTDLKV
jgi:hypothetical protein